MMDGYHGYGADGGDWVLMALMMLALSALVVFGAALAYRALAGPPAAGSPAAGSPAAGSKRNAQEVLEERFARGEIDVEEYTLRRDLLRTG